MKYSVEHDDKIVIFTLKNDSLDHRISADLKSQILILCQPEIDALMIDLTKVNSLDSSGLGALLLAHRQLKDHGIPIFLIGVQEMVKSIMSISQTEHLFEFYDTIDDVYNTLQED